MGGRFFGMQRGWKILWNATLLEDSLERNAAGRFSGTQRGWKILWNARFFWWNPDVSTGGVHGAKRLRIDHPSTTTMTIWIRLHSRIVTMSTNKFLHSIATLHSSKTRICKLLDNDFICIRFGSAGINDEYVKSIR